MISRQLPNYLYFFFVVFSLRLLCKVGWFNSTKALYDIYVVVIENSYKFFFFSDYFILFS